MKQGRDKAITTMTWRGVHTRIELQHMQGH